jgi:hypothetical protein
VRFRSTGLGTTELRGYLEFVQRSDNGLLTARFQTTEPVKWHLGVSLEPSDIPKLLKVMFKPSLILKTTMAVFRVKKNPKEPPDLMKVDWPEIKPAKKGDPKGNK